MPRQSRFGRPVGPGYSFGLDRDAIVIYLRTMADAVEAGTLPVQAITETSITTIEDFQMVEVTIIYPAKFSDPAVE